MKKLALPLFVLAILVYLLTPSIKPKKLPETLLPELDLSGVSEIKRISPNEGTVTLYYDTEEKLWRVKELSGYPAYAVRIREIFYGITALRPLQIKTNNPERYKELGLDAEKAKRLILKDFRGKTIADFWIGTLTADEATGFTTFYLRKEGDAQTYKAMPGFDITGEAEQFAFTYLTNFYDDQIKEIKLFTGGRERKLKKEAFSNFLKDLNLMAVVKDDGEKPVSIIRFVMNDHFDVNLSRIKKDNLYWTRIELIPTSNVLKDNVSALLKAVSQKHKGFLYKLPIDKEDQLLEAIR